jgi:hypothetical protein
VPATPVPSGATPLPGATPRPTSGPIVTPPINNAGADMALTVGGVIIGVLSVGGLILIALAVRRARPPRPPLV